MKMFSAAALLLVAAVCQAADVPATGRPADDIGRDADRKPAEMLAFAGVKPGQTVIDFMPGRGYFTRIFANAVGPQGQVWAVTPQLQLDRFKDRPRPAPVSGEPGRSNVHESIGDASLNVPVKADVAWTSQNYHDIRIWGGAEATASLNKAVFDALKPGGVYVVLDHAATAGLDDASMSKQHRIDEAIVKKEVQAAGFMLDGESQALRNPADPHTANVFDPSIRGKTDQFILRFKKPAK
jgi:predicted methyltransferase